MRSDCALCQQASEHKSSSECGPILAPPQLEQHEGKQSLTIAAAAILSSQEPVDCLQIEDALRIAQYVIEQIPETLRP